MQKFLTNVNKNILNRGDEICKILKSIKNK